MCNKAALGFRSRTRRCAIKVDCDLIMEGDTKPAGWRDREGLPIVGACWVGVGKYSQDQISVLWDSAWETPVHDSCQFTALFFFELCFGCVGEGKRSCSEALLTARHMRSHCRVVRKGLLWSLM